MIGVIDYKAGNAPSVFNAFAKLGHDVRMVKSPEELGDVSGIVLPESLCGGYTKIFKRNEYGCRSGAPRIAR